MNNDNRLRLSEAKNLFRQALQRQNDRAAGFKMPDDMEQRVMKSLQTLSDSPLKGEKDSPRPSLQGRESSLFKGESERVWGFLAIAACVLLLIIFNIEKPQPEQQPRVIAEVVPEPQDSAEERMAGNTEKHDVPRQGTQRAVTGDTACRDGGHSVPCPEKPLLARRNKPAVREEITAEPPAEEAVPMETPAEEPFPEERLPDTNNPYLVAAAQLQDVRARGERLDREVAMLMNRP